jgi:hypothetical protein
MSAVDVLLEPQECRMLFVDFQAGRGFGAGLAYARDDSSRMIVSKD